MNDAVVRQRLADLENEALEEHPEALDAIHAHIVSELEELRRNVPPAGRGAAAAAARP